MYDVKLYHKIKWKLSTNPNPKQIISGDENWLFLGNHYENINETVFGIDTFNTEELNNIKMVQSERKRFLDSLGIDYYVMIAPEKSTIYKEKIPIKIDVERTKSNQVIDLLSQLGITVIFPKDTLLKSKQSLQVYYKYDSHWNANGAYIAYTQLMDSLKIKHPELQKISISDFNITTEYKNRENDLSNILFVESDWDIIPEYSLKRPLAMVNKWDDINLIKSGGGTGPMKPGNLRLQGAKSGGKLSADEEKLFVRFVCDEALFLCQNMKGMCIYEHEENLYIRIRNRRSSG